MQNALLIGLSRQMTLERQMDVIANNVANANTNGFKADHSLFEEYLNSNAREDNFVGSDRRVSYVQDRGTFRDVGQGPMEPTKNPLDMAISGDAYFAVQANGAERYTRDGKFSLNSTGQLVTSDGEVDTTTAGGRAFYQMRGVFAEFERSTISERSRAMHAFLRAAGRFRRFGEVAFVTVLLQAHACTF